MLADSHATKTSENRGNRQKRNGQASGQETDLSLSYHQSVYFHGSCDELIEEDITLKMEDLKENT
jgi:hypothetical protein